MAKKATAVKADVEVEVPWVPNATYPDGPPEGREKLKIERIVDGIVATAKFSEKGDKVLKRGRTVAVMGEHGNGKTTGFEQAIERRFIGTDRVQLGCVSLSMSAIDLTDISMPIPQVEEKFGYVLKQHLTDLLRPGRPFVLLLDDWRRTPKSLMSALLQLTQSGKFAGLEIEGLAGVLLVDNPPGEGYLGIQVGDIALESRFPHRTITRNDTGWKEALAQKYAEVDLTDVFKLMDSITDPQVARAFNPRVLDHVLDVTLAGLPPILGVPMTPTLYQTFEDTAGNDQRDNLLRQVASALNVPYTEPDSGTLQKAMKLALEKGWNVSLVGPHGVAKTATVEALGTDELEVHVLSAPNTTLLDLGSPVPTDDGITYVLDERFTGRNGKQNLYVFDESWRGKEIRAQLLQLTGSRKLFGQTLGDHCVGVWAINNPAKFGGMQYPVSHVDEAMTSRFTVNLLVTSADTAWREYLMDTYGEATVKPFLEWWAHGLTETEREYISPRTLEILIESHVFTPELDLDECIPLLGNGRLPVKLNRLKALLAGREVLGFEKIMSEFDKVLDTLDNPADDAEFEMVSYQVTDVLMNCELLELQGHEDRCLELVKRLPRDKKTALILRVQSNEGLRTFWAGIYTRTAKGS